MWREGNTQMDGEENERAVRMLSVWQMFPRFSWCWRVTYQIEVTWHELFPPLLKNTHSITPTHLWADCASGTNDAHPQASTSLLTNDLHFFFLSYMPFRSKCCVRGSPVQWCLFRLFHFLWACLKVESTCQHGVQWVQMMMQRSTLALMKWRNVGFTVFSSGDKKIWIKFAAVPQCTSIKEWL